MRRMSISAGGALAAALFAFAAFGGTPAAAASLSPGQADEVRAIVRDYLVKNPDVLDEALKALEAKKKAERLAKETEVAKKSAADPRAFGVGPDNAPITIVEFFDYRCPYCKASTDWVFQTLAARKDVRIVFREFPILGPDSLEASRAAIASIKQGKYLAFHRALMSSKGDLATQKVNALAKAVGVDVTRMRKDMTDPAIDKIILDTHALGVDANVEGTPAFAVNGRFIHGYQPDELDKALKDAVAKLAKK